MSNTNALLLLAVALVVGYQAGLRQAERQAAVQVDPFTAWLNSGWSPNA